MFANNNFNYNYARQCCEEILLGASRRGGVVASPANYQYKLVSVLIVDLLYVYLFAFSVTNKVLVTSYGVKLWFQLNCS